MTWFLGALFAVTAVFAMHGLDSATTALHTDSPGGEHAECEDCPHGGHLAALCAVIVTVGAIAVVRNRSLWRSITSAAASGATTASQVTARSRPPTPRPPAWVRLEVVLC